MYDEEFSEEIMDIEERKLTSFVEKTLAGVQKDYLSNQAKWDSRLVPLDETKHHHVHQADKLALSHLLSGLTLQQRYVLYKTDVEGWTETEVARSLGISQPLVNKIKKKARKIVRASAEGEA